MAVSIWTWKGGTGISTVAGNWTLTAGSGNATGFPAPGDSVIVPSGLIQDGLSELLGRGDVTVQAGAAINAGGGISLGVTAGTSGTLTVNGTGASVVASTAGITDGNAGSGVISVLNGGSITASTLSLGGGPAAPGGGKGAFSVSGTSFAEVLNGLALWGGSALSVDAVSGIDVGTGNTYVPGAVLVETGNKVTGSGVIFGSLVNNGTVDIKGNGPQTSPIDGTLQVTGSISGTGLIKLEPGSTLLAVGKIGSGETIAFSSGGPQKLVLGSPDPVIATTISGWAQGDRIEFANGITITGTATVSGGVTTIPFTNAAGTAGTYQFTNMSFAQGTPGDFVFGTDFKTGAQYMTPARIFSWRGGSGTSFNGPANWNDLTDGLNPSVLAPGELDTARFASNAGTIGGTGSVDVLDFQNNGKWTLAASSSLFSAQALQIARNGTGITSVDVGATATLVSGGFIDVGVGAGNQGSLRITGGGNVRETGPGVTQVRAMNIGGAGGRGTIEVVGAGSLLDLGFNGLQAGYGGGTGALIVRLGGSVTAATVDPTQLSAVTIGTSGGAGSVLVTDLGSALTASGPVNIGFSGNGSLTIENQGTVRVGAAALAGMPGLDIGSGTGVGAVTVSGSQSLLVNTGTLIAGDTGYGGLSIRSGGTVVTTADAIIGNAAGAGGSYASVIGAGTNFLISGALLVGKAAQGGLLVGGGAHVTAASIDAGSIAGGFGDIIVTGTASTLSTPGQLIIGDLANADMVVSNGATVSSGRLDIGLNKGSSGVVDVEGTSSLNIAGALNIGGAGNAVLSLGLNASVTAGSIVIGKGGVLVEFGDPITTGTITNNGTVNVTGGVNVINATSEYLNNGLIVVTNGATEQINTPLLDGIGGISINSGGIVILNAGSVANTQTISFTDDSGGVLSINAAKLGGFHAVVNPFVVNNGTTLAASHNTIQLPGVAGFSDSISADGKTLTVFSNGGSVGSVLFTAPVPAGFGTALVQCFVAGTRIETAAGPVAVEALTLGDTVLTLLGGSGRIIWAGSRTIDCTRHPRPQAVLPVLIARDSFGAGMPSRDVMLSPDHAVYVDGVLIPVKHLINGTTVRQVARGTVTYHHIELEQHDVVLAEGLPAETYLDIGDRSAFAGGAVTALHPDFAARSWEMGGCAELVVTGERLARARALCLAGMSKDIPARRMRQRRQ